MLGCNLFITVTQTAWLSVTTLVWFVSCSRSRSALKQTLGHKLLDLEVG